jgi:hypothetical protein
MNSQSSETFFPSPQATHQVSLHPTANRVLFETAIAQAILTAALAGTFSATVAIGSASSLSVQYVMTLLNQASYVASVTGSNLVVSW